MGKMEAAGPQIRDIVAQDLDIVTAWLMPGMAATLPGAEAGGERWLLAAQADGRPLACLRLRPAIGLSLPRHWYHVGCVVHAAAELGLFHRLNTLQLGSDLTGATELADIAWDRSALGVVDAARVLRALVGGALRLIADERERHAARVIVELPGLRDTDGGSPFWRGLGRHFYDGDPLDAARRFGPDWRSHVAALLPRQPVYAAFLSADAQAAMGQADPTIRVLLDVLWEAGLRYDHHLRIDDGGPVFEAPTDLLTGYSPR